MGSVVLVAAGFVAGCVVTTAAFRWAFRPYRAVLDRALLGDKVRDRG